MSYDMLIKTLMLNSLPYIVGIASSIVAAHHIAPSLGTASGFLSDTTTKSAMVSRQVVNRSHKSARMPIRQAKPQAHDEEPVKMPIQIAPNPKTKPIVSCQPVSPAAILWALDYTTRSFRKSIASASISTADAVV